MIRFIRSSLRPLRLLINRCKDARFSKKFGSFGANTIVSRQSKLIPRNIYLGNNVIIQDGQNFISNTSKLFVGDFSVISANCIIVPGEHKLKVGIPFYISAADHIADEEHDIIIKEDCWIGAGCILLPNVTIGRGCVIGAGSVVTKSIPDYAVAVGVPARVIATKFTYLDIIKHEQLLYPASKRISCSYLKTLFETTYKGLHSIGADNITEDEAEKLTVLMLKYNIKSQDADK